MHLEHLDPLVAENGRQIWTLLHLIVENSLRTQIWTSVGLVVDHRSEMQTSQCVDLVVENGSKMQTPGWCGEWEQDVDMC